MRARLVQVQPISKLYRAFSQQFPPAVAGFPSRCRLPQPLPASPTVAGFPNRCQFPQPLPASPAIAGFANRCSGFPSRCRLPWQLPANCCWFSLFVARRQGESTQSQRCVRAHV